MGLGHFWGFKILNFNIFGYEDFVDIFGGHHKIELYLGVISGSLLKVKVHNGDIFWGC